MKLERKGITRLVFIFKHFVIKIPNFTCQHNHFLLGCYANWSERRFCKIMKKTKFYNLVAPSLFCSWFGLFQVQRRCIELDRHLTDEEIEKFRGVCQGDLKPENFGYYQNRIVCLDYI